MTADRTRIRRSQSVATEASLRAFFEGSGFAAQMRENFAGEV
jgi:hypothetical protein